VYVLERERKRERQRQRQRAYVLCLWLMHLPPFVFMSLFSFVWRERGWWWRWFNGVDRETVVEREG
jgi:hypothetical protein